MCVHACAECAYARARVRMCFVDERGRVHGIRHLRVEVLNLSGHFPGKTDLSTVALWSYITSLAFLQATCMIA